MICMIYLIRWRVLYKTRNKLHDIKFRNLSDIVSLKLYLTQAFSISGYYVAIFTSYHRIMITSIDQSINRLFCHYR